GAHGLGIGLPAQRRQVSWRRRGASRAHGRSRARRARAALRAERAATVRHARCRVSFDLVIRGGRVVDGTGMPGFTADVAGRDGVVVRGGRRTEAAPRPTEPHGRLGADGCIVTPGFIDVHTHYDAQLHWEPTASPASWHGVTTVLTGNCGFTLAPAKPEDTTWLAQMLSRVEGMSPECLAAGLRWRG